MVHINTKNERIFTQSMDTPRRNPKPVDVWLINAMNSILNTAFAILISRNRYGNYSGSDPNVVNLMST